MHIVCSCLTHNIKKKKKKNRRTRAQTQGIEREKKTVQKNEKHRIQHGQRNMKSIDRSKHHFNLNIYRMTSSPMVKIEYHMCSGSGIG